MEFDVYNESDYYTYLYVGVGGNGWYPQTGGDILLLPNASKHVVVPIADMARDIDVSNVDWLEFEPETLVEEENYQGKRLKEHLEQECLWNCAKRLERLSLCHRRRQTRLNQHPRQQNVSLLSLCPQPLFGF